MIVSGHNYSCWGTNVSGPVMSGHKSNVSGHKRVWKQTCLGTVMYGLNCAGPIMYGHKRGGTVNYYPLILIFKTIDLPSAVMTSSFEGL